MVILRFESEDFNVRDLLNELNQMEIPAGIDVSVSASVIAQDGERPLSVDILEIISRIDVTEEAYKQLLIAALKYGFSKIKEIAFAQPHILIRFDNGAKRKIIYDKGDTAIVEELLSYVKNGDVKSVVFKS